MNVASKLEQLASTLTFIEQGQAQRIIRLLNHRISRLLGPHIVDVLWKSSSENEIVFRPLDSATFDHTDRGGSGWFYVPKDPYSRTGLWTWVYENNKAVWVENIVSVPSNIDGLFRFLEKPVMNKATRDEIALRYLSFFRETDSILVFPLMVKNSVQGIYSIELPVSGSLDKWTFETLERLSRSVADVLRRFEELELSQQQISREIHLFEELVYQPNVPLDNPPLRIFLCHASEDKEAVRNLYDRLYAEDFSPWLDENELLPGQDWKHEIEKAVSNSDVVIICLSTNSTTKKGFVNSEINYALDVADKQPEGTIFLIPLKLEECKIPDRLQRLHWVNLFDKPGYNRLLKALNARASTRG